MPLDHIQMEKNIAIFKSMGEAVEKYASDDIKVLVVGNPANTNAVVMSEFCPKVPKKNFTSMTRLDHHRAQGQIAKQAQVPVQDVKNVIIWGNHSSTQFPDVNHGTVSGKPIREVIEDDEWLNGEFIETIQKRGAAIISARKASSALSAARAAVQHMRSWILGTEPGEFVSMGVLSDENPYSLVSGIVYSMPCTCANGEWSVVSGLDVSDDFSQRKMRATGAELVEEKNLAMSLLGK
jgi:malate dehydrogenase